MEGKTVQALWLDYQFLTKEMQKFLIEQDMELFNNLLKQREGVQAILERTPDDGFKFSPQGRSLLNEIQQINKAITENLQVLLASSKRQHQVSQAYNAASTTAVSRMNWQR